MDHFASSSYLFSVLMKMQARSSALLFSLRTLSIAGPFLGHHPWDWISHLASNFCDGFSHGHSTSHRASCLVLNLHVKPDPQLATSGICRNIMAFLYKDHSSLAFLYLRVCVFIHSSDGHHRYQLKHGAVGLRASKELYIQAGTTCRSIETSEWLQAYIHPRRLPFPRFVSSKASKESCITNRYGYFNIKNDVQYAILGQ